MSVPTYWWIAAGLLVAVELATGSFYLLMLSLGAVAAALAAHLGADATVQIACVALVGGAAVVLWHLKRRRGPPAPAAGRDPSVNLDIGQRVHVSQWRADGTARVHYRGTHWTARLQEGEVPGAGLPHAGGEFLIRAVEGNELILGR